MTECVLEWLLVCVGVLVNERECVCVCGCVGVHVCVSVVANLPE